jgi:hypothetical protein
LRTIRQAPGRILESTLVGGVRYTTIDASTDFLRAKGSAPAISPSHGDLVEIERQLDAAKLFRRRLRVLECARRQAWLDNLDG